VFLPLNRVQITITIHRFFADSCLVPCGCYSLIETVLKKNNHPLELKPVNGKKASRT
jgi:hypothetical protein